MKQMSDHGQTTKGNVTSEVPESNLVRSARRSPTSSPNPPRARLPDGWTAPVVGSLLGARQREDANVEMVVVHLVGEGVGDRVVKPPRTAELLEVAA